MMERFRRLTDDELLRVIEEHADNYTEEALDIARAEVDKRGGIDKVRVNIQNLRQQDEEKARREAQAANSHVHASQSGTLSSPADPEKRFLALRSVATAYKVIAWIVGIAFAGAAIVAMVGAVQSGSPLVGVMSIIITVAVGAVVVTVLTSFGDLIMVAIATEENTRATRELLRIGKEIT